LYILPEHKSSHRRFDQLFFTRSSRLPHDCMEAGSGLKDPADRFEGRSIIYGKIVDSNNNHA
jgi:hypothetical protein